MVLAQSDLFQETRQHKSIACEDTTQLNSDVCEG